MIKNLIGSVLFVAAFTFAAFAQVPQRGIDQMPRNRRKPIANQAKPKPSDDQNVDLKTGEKITRGAALTGKVPKVSLAEALKSPEKFAGKTVSVSGVIVRSCKMEGCWMQLAPSKDAESARVTFGNHDFFIPLNAAGLNATAEGKFAIKNLSKTEVDHLINEDGAKFDKRNADGGVTEISFVATGVELSKK